MFATPPMPRKTEQRIKSSTYDPNPSMICREVSTWASSIGKDSIAYIMVIPYVELSNLAIGARERLSAVPPDVVVHIVLITLLPQRLWERILFSLVGVSDVSPRSERATHSNTIIIDLISTSNPDEVRDYSLLGAWGMHTLRGMVSSHALESHHSIMLHHSKHLHRYQPRIHCRNGT